MALGRLSKVLWRWSPGRARSIPIGLELTCGPTIVITVTAKAYGAIKATLPAGTKTWPTSPGDQGDVVIQLDQAMVARLNATRDPGESYSEVIIRVARG